ncbi:MAG: DUF2249 domain-containing protein [Gammaproteobacteria bacterium]|uniref:DUF2249 domain-containing protein n=1 Tax=Candidatus Thiopontia autotrophica TaxID=2841688 RepID=A0A8J6TVT3_9GAMM|nr:DUF2249 domain-containing protein [Candidatus Thiopontia autotrophica]MBL6969009.1 DUF2249 domain-containing protein [Gammaproteobacteria bacterium]
MRSNQPIAVIDVRGLKCPEPFKQATSMAMTLQPGDSFQLHISVEPHPLYGHLNELGFTTKTETTADGDFLITIAMPEKAADNSKEVFNVRSTCRPR